MRTFGFIILLIFIGGLFLFTIIIRQEQQFVSKVKEPIVFCGTSLIYNEYEGEGRQLFNTNCAACHKLDKNMTGPALRNVGKKYDSITIINFIHGKETQIQNEDYDMKCMAFPHLTSQEITDIIKYTSH